MLPHSGVRTGFVGLGEDSNQRLRYIFMSRKLAKVGIVTAVSDSTIATVSPITGNFLGNTEE